MVTVKIDESSNLTTAVLRQTPQSGGYLNHTAYKNLLQLRRLKLIIEQVLSYAACRQSGQLRILELGCGIGAITYPLSSLGYEVVGIDIDPDSIASCNARNSFPNATYAVGNAETLDLKEQFDVVIASEIIEHCPQPALVLQTLGRHLVQGGIGIVTVPNGYCLNELVFSWLFQKLGIASLFHRLPKRVYTFLTGSPTPYYSENIFCHHVQFFSFNKFGRLLVNNSFRVALVWNLDLGLFLDWKWLNPLKRIEFKLANLVPHSLAGGWVSVITRKGETVSVS
jgi:SAM-dependent methyltransferase